MAFFGGTFSLGLATVKTAGSHANAKSAAAAKTFLKLTCAVAPALSTIGPCGFGGSACPISWHVYSPPSADVTVSTSRASPIRDGSKVTSTVHSAPAELSAAGAATCASVSKSPEPPDSASLYVSALRKKLVKRKRSVCAPPSASLNWSAFVSPAGSACSLRSYRKVPSSADVSVSCDCCSRGSSGLNSSSSSPRALGSSVSDAGAETSALLTDAANVTGTSSGLVSGSARDVSCRSGACSSSVCSTPPASALSCSL
mmetsp:Transcript_11812/g.31045  ORF Transcript_11812/g.31045 Transcript_11812/m.31045 type:complete len:257 (-) Transcript_11812:2381-3151(-)